MAAAAVAEEDEPTSTERAIAAVRDHLTSTMQAMGAGSAEAAGRSLKQKRQRHRLSLNKPAKPTAPVSDPASSRAAGDGARPFVAPPMSDPASSRAAGDGARPFVAPPVVAPPAATTEIPPGKSSSNGARKSPKGKTKKQKRDLVTRYVVLLVCIVAIIVCLLGMSFLSWKSNGRWWGPLPEHRALL
jgi:hypothetical protein